MKSSLWITKPDAAALLGISARQFFDAIQPKLPVEAIERKGRSLLFFAPTVVKEWVAYRQAIDAPKTVVDGDDLLAAGGDSAGLERYRNAKADLAEMERDRLLGSLVAREQIDPALVRAGLVLRRAGETLQRLYGNDASSVLNDALDEAEQAWDRMLSNVGSDGDSDPERTAEDDGGGADASTKEHEAVRGAGDRPAHRTLRGPTVQMRAAAV